MTLVVAAAVLAGVGAPYLLPGAGLKPITGAALWLSALLLRASLVLLIALTAILYLPATALFRLATHWCFHAVIPFFTTHLGFSGHRVGDAATLLPGLVLGISLIWAIFALWRTTRAVRRWLKRSSLGEGPGESVIVGGSEVVVAAAGIRDAKVVVSTGALAELDDQELAAGLEHERGHIVRHHPYLTLLGNLAFALARPLPGSRDALDRLRFNLERDADEYAVDRTRDPVALASAICKAAAGRQAPTPALAGLGGYGTAARLRLLLDRPPAEPSALAERAGQALVAALLALVLAAFAMTPALASAGVASIQQSNAAHTETCPG